MKIEGTYKLIDTANEIISGEIEILKGCRIIASLASDIEEKDQGHLLPIIGIVSETDDIPLEESRKNFSKIYLQEIDEKSNEYLSKNKNTILKICKEITKKYSDDINRIKKIINSILVKNEPMKIYFNDLYKNYSYETETELILKELITCKSEEQTRNIVKDIFTALYGEAPRESKTIFENIGNGIWVALK